MLYERIKEACKKKGVTVSELERDLGFGRSSISKVDKHKPSLERMEQIAKYLGVSVSDLTGAADEQPDDVRDRERYYYLDPDARAAAQEVYERPGMRVLFSAARGVSEQDLRTVATILERMKATNPDG